MPQLYIFAGPNGSGKSSILKPTLEKSIELQNLTYLNADSFERKLKENRQCDFAEFGISVTEEELKNYLQNSTLVINKICPDKQVSPEHYLSLFSVTENCLVPGKVPQDSYFSAAIIDFLVNKLIELKISFSYETVMSHAGKNDLFEKAKNNGFEINLLFVTTIDPEINISRVRNRVATGGHNVPVDRIVQRYYKSLDNLYETLKLADRAELYDNSGARPVLIARKISPTVLQVEQEAVPDWYFTYVEDKAKNVKPD